MTRIDRSMRVDWTRAAEEAEAKHATYKNTPHYNAAVFNGVDGMVTGIVGEMEFARVFRLPRKLFNLDGTGDGGSDFYLRSGTSVDLKTTCSNAHAKSQVGAELAPNSAHNLQVRAEMGPINADTYALAWVPTGTQQVHLLGWCWAEELMERGKRDFGYGPNWWVPITDLRPILELIDLNNAIPEFAN